MKNINDGFVSLLAGRRTSVTEQVDGPQEGHVLLVDVVNQRAQVTLTNSSFSTGKQFEVDYGNGLTPSIGDKCLVIFVGQGVDRGWLLASKS